MWGLPFVRERVRRSRPAGATIWLAGIAELRRHNAAAAAASHAADLADALAAPTVVPVAPAPRIAGLRLRALFIFGERNYFLS